MNRLIIVLFSLWLLAGCSTMNVTTDYWPEADFSSFKTFQYNNSNRTFANVSPLAHQRIVSGIRSGMSNAGLREVNANPDLYVTYYGEKNETRELQTSGWGYHHPPDWHMNSSHIPSQRYAASRQRHTTTSVVNTTTRVVTIREKSIIIDMWNAGNKELVWRAEISDTLSDNPDRNTANINRGLSRAFENFPPASSK